MRGENKTVDSRSSDQQFEALTKYGTDLTAKAAHLDPIVGRDEEVRQSNAAKRMHGVEHRRLPAQPVHASQ